MISVEENFPVLSKTGSKVLIFVLTPANKASDQAYKLNYSYFKTLKLNFKQVKLVSGVF